MTGDLAEFLLARITEDEEVARAAKPGPWRWEHQEVQGGISTLVSSSPEPQWSPKISSDRDAMLAYNDAHSAWVVAEGTAADEWGATIDIAEPDAEHIARWDPARALAECEAKRRIVAEAVPEIDGLTSAYVDAVDAAPFSIDYPSDTLLRLLALPYADHPDYREQWRP